jgi:acrylyl-CoA reductase (NADPH)
MVPVFTVKLPAPLKAVESVVVPLALREQAWDRLARDIDLSLLESMVEDITLDDCVDRAAHLIDGKIRGRLVVNIA